MLLSFDVVMLVLKLMAFTLWLAVDVDAGAIAIVAVVVLHPPKTFTMKLSSGYHMS